MAAALMEVLGSGTTRVVVLPGASKKYTEFWCVVRRNSDTTCVHEDRKAHHDALTPCLDPRRVEVRTVKNLKMSPKRHTDLKI